MCRTFSCFTSLSYFLQLHFVMFWHSYVLFLKLYLLYYSRIVTFLFFFTFPSFFFFVLSFLSKALTFKIPFDIAQLYAVRSTDFSDLLTIFTQTGSNPQFLYFNFIYTCASFYFILYNFILFYFILFYYDS